MKVFAEQKVISICMLAFFGASLFLKMFLGFLYGHMIKEADNMATTNNKPLKQCKIKFSNCYELNNGISNVAVFVDKFISRLSLGPFSFDMMYHLSGQMMLLSVVFSGIGICRSIMAGRTLGEILPFYIASFAGLYLYFSVSSLVDIKEKRKKLRINLMDYLENHLASRINVTKRDMDMLYGDASYTEAGGRKRRGVELMPIGVRTGEGSRGGDGNREDGARGEDGSRASDSESGSPADSAAVTDEELEALLREFLTG